MTQAPRIQVLPDHVINQIAAGEVVQRPASVLKELLENAVDSGATLIKVNLKDSGRSLIEVIDNGQGIAPEQVPLALQRHATSKLNDWEDLYRLMTYGFRGEALASIAAVSQMELASRVKDLELGVLVEAHGGQILQNQPVALPTGTRVSVRSLFFNVPARRNFLKKDSTEYKNLEDEFIRLALAKPELALELKSQSQTVYSLKPGNLRQRIQALLGKSFSEGLVPLEEDTQLVGLSGFVAKPALCRKTRYAQYLFVNGRYFKDAYLQHAVSSAMEGLLPAQHHPAYVLNFRVDPAKMDVNVHPSKIEVKFEEDQGIYAILKSAVRRSLGQYQLSPSLDFELEPLPGSWGIQSTAPERLNSPEVRVNPHYNPFQSPPTGGASSSVAGYHRMLENLNQSPDLLTDGWISPDGIGVFRSGGRCLVVQIRSLLRATMRDRLLQDLDQLYRPGYGSLPLESVVWQSPGNPDDEQGLAWAANLGIELALGPEKSSYAVKSIPVGVTSAEVLDLLDWFWAQLEEGRTPTKDEALQYLAQTRGLNAQERPFDPTNLAQVLRVLQRWIQEERPFLDPDGRTWGWYGEPQQLFNTLIPNYELSHQSRSL
ncbi:MAG: DNA mismatch repair endonuclease MutL [Bacteroidota bacterium]